EEAAAEDDVHRGGLSDRARESLRAARARDDPEGGLRLAEARGLGCNDQIARQRELAPAAEAVAGDGCDERRPEVPERVPPLDASGVIELERAAARELADVGAGRERTLGAAEHDAADRLVAVEALQLRHELVHQLVRQRVELLRPVQQHDGDRLVALYD